VSDASDGLLDASIFIHAAAQDEHSDECRRFLIALEEDRASAWLEPLVLHELSYALPHYMKQLTRERLAAYLLSVLGWPGVRGEKDVMVDAVERWQQTPGLGFVDAFLAARAAERRSPVYTKNLRHFRSQGVSTPERLPEG
jgi:predicted nucleic acid-binding protein